MSKNIKQYNEIDQQHGYWEVYFENGQLYYKGSYHNGWCIGYWEEYSSGELRRKAYYIK